MRRADHHALVSLIKAFGLERLKLGQIANQRGRHEYKMPRAWVGIAESKQAVEVRYALAVGFVQSSLEHKVEDVEHEVRLAVAPPDRAGGFAERAVAEHQLAVHAVGQVGLDPLAGEAVGNRLERAGERLAADFQTADAVEFRRGEHGEWEQVGAFALAGEHRLGDRVHGVEGGLRV